MLDEFGFHLPSDINMPEINEIVIKQFATLENLNINDTHTEEDPSS